MFYVYEGDFEPVQESDMHTWAVFFEKNGRRVELTRLDNAVVSTVFLGIDHGLDGEALLFETMVFQDGRPGAQVRTKTVAEARAVHTTLCAEVRQEHKAM